MESQVETKKNKNEIVVLIDTREQNSWPLSFKCEAGGLKTGDYAIKNLETFLCVERKATIDELCGNLVKDYDRFIREMERMLEHAKRYVICEFPLADVMNFPHSRKYKKVNSGSITGKFLLKRIMEIELNYNVHFVFCEGRADAIKYFESLVKRVSEKYGK